MPENAPRSRFPAAGGRGASTGRAGGRRGACCSHNRRTMQRPAWFPPPHVLRAYLLGCVPLFIVYSVANETDGDFSRGFELWRSVFNTLLFAGPAFVLLLPVWAYTGWMERHGFSVPRLLANHGAMALVFAVAVQAASYGLIWAVRDQAAAERARAQWFIWQAMFMMMMYWAAAGGFTAYRAVLRAREQAAAAQEAQALLARTELAALRNRLNPHFLFNTLHSIIALTRKDAPRAEQALLIFSDLLRHVLSTEKSGSDQVPLAQELDFTRDYLALEALRLGDRLTVRWQLDDNAMACTVPALTVQPLVENSIRHAFDPRVAPGVLSIHTRLDAGTLHVEVRDDGPGSAPEATTRGQGLGLKTVARRLALLFGERATMAIDTRPGAGFAVRLTMPGVA
jgi:signal transduction histidine kinase